MPFINVKLVKGRSPSEKGRLVRKLSEDTASILGISEDKVVVVLEEIKPENWIRGGVSAGNPGM